MARAIIPLMTPVPDGATKADRERMFEEWKAELGELNPHLFNPNGSQKTFWQYLTRIFKR